MNIYSTFEYKTAIDTYNYPFCVWMLLQFNHQFRNCFRSPFITHFLSFFICHITPTGWALHSIVKFLAGVTTLGVGRDLHNVYHYLINLPFSYLDFLHPNNFILLFPSLIFLPHAVIVSLSANLISSG